MALKNISVDQISALYLGDKLIPISKGTEKEVDTMGSICNA